MITYSKLIENAKKKIDLNDLEYRAIYAFLEDILKCDKTHILLLNDEVVNDDVLEKFSEMLADYIIDNKPIEYILGYTYFCGNKIKVDSRVLIPRDETEELTYKAIESIRDNSSVLDLCCGSGAIAIAIKKANDTANVYASDISKDAIDVASSNAIFNNVDINFIQGNLIDPFIGKSMFDVIVCNPPYINKSYELNGFVKHEPEIALFAEEEGFASYRAIISNLDKVLKIGGKIFFEIGYNMKDKIFEICKEYLNKYSIECFKDINDKDRIIVIQLL